MTERSGTDRAAQTCGSGRSRGPNVVGVLWALIFGVVAAIGLTGNFRWLTDSGTKWIIAAVVAVVGLGLLVTALPSRSGD